MSDLPTIDMRAEELARSGAYHDVLQIEPVLYSEYGGEATKAYIGVRATAHRLNELCRQARGDAGVAGGEGEP